MVGLRRKPIFGGSLLVLNNKRVCSAGPCHVLLVSRGDSTGTFGLGASLFMPLVHEG